MKIIPLVALLWWLVGGFAMVAHAYDFSEADNFYAGRADADTNITAAINAYSRSLTTQLSRQDLIYAATQIARLHAYRGMTIPESRIADRRPHFERCMQAIERLSPDRISASPEYYFWSASCLALWAEANGILASLSHSRRLLNLAQAGRRLDPSYEGGGFDRVLGVTYAKLPAFNPFGPSGDLQRALQHFNASVNSPAYRGSRRGPQASGDYYFETYVYYAEALAQAGQRRAARTMVLDALERIELEDVAEHRVPETIVAERMLRALLPRL